MGITIHQALHGYSEGHRQLACSATLSPKDARLVLVMSDVSGSGVVGEGIPYLTGYPLQESGLYAIAKTWPAPEMPRPGCVWTHTLLIEFSELAALERPSSLTDLFRNPSDETIGSFGFPLHDVSGDTQRQSLSPLESTWFWRMAGALYDHPQDQVWARRDSDADVDRAVLCLWDQQWPRLRRSFRFCTLTTTDRSHDGLPFDLQLCPDTASSRLRFHGRSESWEASDLIDARWLQLLVADAGLPRRETAGQLTRALRLLGADVLGGREAMKPICELLVALSDQQNLHIDSAISLVEGAAPLATSMVAKGLVLRTAVAEPDALDFEAQDFVIRNLDLLSQEEIAKHANGLARQICGGDPARFLALCFDERSTVRDAMRIAARDIPLDDLLFDIFDTSSLAAPLLTVRPDLASTIGFWDRTQAWPSAMRNDDDFNLADKPILRAMILGLREKGAIASALQEVGALAVIDCLAEIDAEGVQVPQFNAWLHQACADTDAVARFLSQVRAPLTGIVPAISQQLHPDSVPNDYGDDPWFIALNQIHLSPIGLSVELLTYGFRRALGWRSRSVAPLLLLTFEAMHRAAESQKIPNDCWEQVEGALPMAKFNESSDRGQKIRKAVAKRAVDLRIEATAFVELTRSETLFQALLDEVWSEWGGRRYLKDVRDSLQVSQSSKHRKRYRLIDEYLDSRTHWWS